MYRTLTISYDQSNEDIPVMCVTESSVFSVAVIKMFTGEKAEQLYKELTGQNVVIKLEGEEKE